MNDTIKGEDTGKTYLFEGREITFEEYMEKIGENLGGVRERIRVASPGKEVLLLAATKTVPAEVINGAARRFGLDLIGENKVQELTDKYPYLERERLHIHFIGHLQTNKVKYIIDKVEMIHSLDSVSLAAEIGKRASAAGRVMPVLAEINVGREAEKSGVYPEDAAEFVKSVSCVKGISVQGLMTMAPAGSTPDEYRMYFTEVKRIFDALKEENIPGAEMRYLSMGMSDSYVFASECGADIVRVGSSIFGKRTYPAPV